MATNKSQFLLSHAGFGRLPFFQPLLHFSFRNDAQEIQAAGTEVNVFPNLGHFRNKLHFSGTSGHFGDNFSFAIQLENDGSSFGHGLESGSGSPDLQLRATYMMKKLSLLN